MCGLPFLGYEKWEERFVFVGLFFSGRSFFMRVSK